MATLQSYVDRELSQLFHSTLYLRLFAFSSESLFTTYCRSRFVDITRRAIDSGMSAVLALRHTFV